MREKIRSWMNPEWIWRLLAASRLAKPAGLHGAFYDVGLLLICGATLVGANVPLIFPLVHVVMLVAGAYLLDVEDWATARGRILTSGLIYSLNFISFAIAQVLYGTAVADALQSALLTTLIAWWGSQKLDRSGAEETEARVHRLNKLLDALNGRLAVVVRQLSEVPDDALVALREIEKLAPALRDASEQLRVFTESVEDSTEYGLETQRVFQEKMKGMV